MEDYSPNKIPNSTRIFNIVWALFLVGVCFYAGINDALIYPGVKGSGSVELTGTPLLFFCLALIFSAINAVITVVNHYDKRNNEKSYKQMSFYLNTLSMFAIILAFGYQFLVNQQSVVVIGSVS